MPGMPGHCRRLARRPLDLEPSTPGAALVGDQFEVLQQQVADLARSPGLTERIAALRARLAGMQRDVSWLSYRAGQPTGHPTTTGRAGPTGPVSLLPVSSEIELERRRREQAKRDDGDPPEST